MKCARGGLAMVALALATALSGAACDKEPRHEAPQRVLVRDGAVRAPEPTLAEADAEVAADAAVPAPAVRVRLPALRTCSAGTWCAPAAQTVAFASPRAADFQGCPTALRMSKNGERFPFDINQSRTGTEHDAGNDRCCYTWRGPCHPVGMQPPTVVGALDDPFAP